MIIKLIEYVPNDSVFPIYFDGLKAIISHDSHHARYTVIVTEIGKHLGDTFNIPKELDTNIIEHNIYPRQRSNIRSEWESLIKLKQNEV